LNYIITKAASAKPFHILLTDREYNAMKQLTDIMNMPNMAATIRKLILDKYNEKQKELRKLKK